MTTLEVDVPATLYPKDLGEGTVNPDVGRDWRLPRPKPRFDLKSYQPDLLPLSVQLEVLRRYNHEYWGGYLQDSEFDAASMHTCRQLEQSVERLTCFHADFGSDELSLRMWWRVMVGEAVKRLGHTPPSWDSYLDSIRLPHREEGVVQRYERGLTVVTINLVANWDPDPECGRRDLYSLPSDEGQKWAGLELLSAYGIHSRLFGKMDGRNLPFALMGAYQGSEVFDHPPINSGARRRRSWEYQPLGRNGLHLSNTVPSFDYESSQMTLSGTVPRQPDIEWKLGYVTKHRSVPVIYVP